MRTAVAWRTGAATDPGLKRTVNEDRILADDVHGIFLVVDGLGGHAAGELAAETAVRVIERNLTATDLDDNSADIEEKIRQSITEANNEIYSTAQSKEEWRGMACVLTLAVARDDRVTIGHVGDSRLYLVWNGNLRKLTSDHSPVGEQEDQGELTEEQAMRHPRRNEVFRDVGSHPRDAHDSDFVEIKTFLFRPDAALLLCSDGLSDVLTSAQIIAILERYDGSPEKTAHQLIDAANDAGGKDNVSVVFVAGPDFLGSESKTLAEVRPRHGVTRMRREGGRWRTAIQSAVLFLAGMLLGILLWSTLERMMPRPAPPQTKTPPLPRPAAHIAVNPNDALGIINALAIARAGDTIEVPAGEYLGPIQLKEHVNILSDVPGQAVLRCSPTSVTDPGLAMIARDIRDVRVQGLRIIGDDAHPLRTGIWIANSSVTIEDGEVSGAIEAGIRIDGTSKPILLANFVHANPGAGITIKDESAGRLAGNWISENGRVAGTLRSGVEIDSTAHPVLERNFIARNGLSKPGAK
ncbi:MAG: protein phosphatase 2C domain-containing protein [Acidobacteriaceae bacterium]|nr:protein phosphatase 2C domain-containing protein [Acidobacteriaceae bacterium]MBV9296980.1 protein phosphatase 2C domain-containing protein [Acidobacteriaceae bacterium]